MNTARLLERRVRLCLWLAERLGSVADRLMVQARRDLPRAVHGSRRHDS